MRYRYLAGGFDRSVFPFVVGKRVNELKHTHSIQKIHNQRSTELGGVGWSLPPGRRYPLHHDTSYTIKV